MGFNHSVTWSYDPVGIISKKRVENRSTPYVHTHKPTIEEYANQTEWVTNTLQEDEEHIISTSGIQTPTPLERISAEGK